jgi:hypothetical protein
MMLRRLRTITGAMLASAMLTAGCGDAEPRRDAVTPSQEVDAQAAQAAGQPAQPQAQPAPPPPPPPDLRLEVNLAERELYVYRKDERIATHPVAVGSKEWPTPTGEWTIGQVVWNPRWIPPKEEKWAEDEEVKEPGDAENPLGRAQLVYRAPNSIHGTNEPSSLGKAVSHGSIRVSNTVAMRLARQVMEAGGAGKDERWYQEARENRKERREVLLPNPIPIRVVAGDEGGEEKEEGSGSGG